MAQRSSMVMGFFVWAAAGCIARKAAARTERDLVRMGER